jgi:hypothetical protein
MNIETPKIKSIISALESAAVLSVDGYLLSVWNIGADESDSALEFSYTDYEGIIFEFFFTWKEMENSVLFPGGFSLKDSEGETVDIHLYKLEAINV